MKLSDVRVKQPESYKVFKFWKDRKEVKEGVKIKARDLYNFFDGTRIWIEVVPLYDFASNCIDSHKWYYTINNGIDFIKQDYNNEFYDSRIKAEETAFFRAFELMELYISDHKIIVNEKTGKTKIPRSK